MIRLIDVAKPLKRSVIGPLVLYALMACAMMSPFASGRLVQSTAADLEAHLSGIVQARAAILEGQFPIRVAPTQDDRLRYPIFQFYGNFPYTVGAILSLTPHGSPYTAWKLVHLIGLTLAGFFTYRTALTLTGKNTPSVIAGATFIFAPYLWTDIHARFAYAETISFLLLPPVMYFSLRSFVRRGWLSIVLAGVSWNFLALSHNITYVYASAFLGLFFLSMLRPTRRGVKRLARVGYGYALGLLLTLWYIIPQLQILKLLNVGEAAGTPFAARVFTTFKILVSPVLLVPQAAADSTARLGPQVGWPILFGAIAAVVMAFVSRWAGRRRRLIVRLFGCFLISFYMVWSPDWSSDPAHSIGNFWLRLPEVFWYVQFTYRILVIVVLFGSLLLPFALGAIFRRGMRATSLLACLFIVGLCGASYYPRHPKMPSDTLSRVVQHPEMGEGGAGLLYQMSSGSIAKMSMFHPDANIAAEAYGTLGHGWVRKPGVMLIARPDDATALLLEGTLPKEFGHAVTLTVSLDTQTLPPITVQPGSFRLRLPIGPMTPSRDETATLKIVADRWLKPRAVDPPAMGEDDISIHLDSLTFETPPKEFPALIGYEQLRDRVALGPISRYALTTNQPAVVQLPVLCYPGLMRVTDRGVAVGYENMGRLLAIVLPAPGEHELAVEFVGSRWANISSLCGWIAVILILGMSVVGALIRISRHRRGAETRPAVRREMTGNFPLRAAIAGFACVVLGLSTTIFADAIRQLRSPARLSITASSFESVYSKPQYAFDNDPSTAWAARGSGPAFMKINLSRPGALHGIVLEARQTALLESWKKVHVSMFLGQQKVFEEDFAVPQQRTTPIVQLDLPSTRTDRVQLDFSDPVLTTRDGLQTFNPGQVNPGYREIRLLWD